MDWTHGVIKLVLQTLGTTGVVAPSMTLGLQPQDTAHIGRQSLLHFPDFYETVSDLRHLVGQGRRVHLNKV